MKNLNKNCEFIDKTSVQTKSFITRHGSPCVDVAF